MKTSSSTKQSRTDWARLAKMPDRDIDLRDVPELDDEFFRTAKIRMPQAKKAVSIRLDQDVLAWFRDQDGAYQTRMNAVLRTYMQAHSH